MSTVQPTSKNGATATPGEVYSALQAQHKAEGGNSRRKHERHSWSVPLRITVTSPETNHERTLNVVSHDISKGGFSFVADHYIHPESQVTTTFNSLPNKPVIAGTVRSCFLADGMSHRVGVQFVDRTG